VAVHENSHHILSADIKGVAEGQKFAFRERIKRRSFGQPIAFKRHTL